MNPLATRIISALVALAVLVSLFYFGGTDGIHAFIILGVVIGSRELGRLLFNSSLPQARQFNYLFVFFSVLVFLFSLRVPLYSTLVFALVSVLFCLLTLFLNSSTLGLEKLVSAQCRGVMGFFYIGLLPFSIDQILRISSNGSWFFTLLAVVFAGDIGGYVFGRLLGKRKLMPLVSPQKTIEGALGGLAFSVLAGYLSHIFWLPHISPFLLMVLSLGTGLVAQLGDLFESLLKRVAEVKDSGTIMPGHGGFLDRIDGLLFAGPVLLWGALLLEGIL